MHRVLLLAVLIAWGCSSAGGPARSPADGQTTVSVGTHYGTIDIVRHHDSRGSYYRMPAEPEDVWPLLLEVHNELGIVRGTVDRGSWLVGNRRFVPPSRLADQPLSRLIQCGVDAFGSPLANNAEIVMSVVTMLTPAGVGVTRMETQLEATARRRGGGSTTVQCGTSGRLEARIAALTQLKIIGP